MMACFKRKNAGSADFMHQFYHLFKYASAGACDFTVIAHRGASAYYPENTLSAFRGAIAMQADMVELDVQLTADGEVVVFHDEKIYRCTRRRGRIADYTLAQLKNMDAGRWFASGCAGEKIPTLEEVLRICQNKIAVNIEIKTEAVADQAAGGIEEKCLRLVRQAGMQDHVVFSSFDPRALLHLKELRPGAATAVLFEKKYDKTGLPSRIVERLGAGAFNCSLKELTSKRLADLRKNAIPFNIYTINDEKNMERVLNLGAEGIFTNTPDILRKVLADVRWALKRNHP